MTGKSRIGNINGSCGKTARTKGLEFLLHKRADVLTLLKNICGGIATETLIVHPLANNIDRIVQKLASAGLQVYVLGSCANKSDVNATIVITGETHVVSSDIELSPGDAVPIAQYMDLIKEALNIHTIEKPSACLLRFEYEGIKIEMPLISISSSTCCDVQINGRIISELGDNALRNFARVKLICKIMENHFREEWTIGMRFPFSSHALFVAFVAFMSEKTNTMIPKYNTIDHGKTIIADDKFVAILAKLHRLPMIEFPFIEKEMDLIEEFITLLIYGGKTWKYPTNGLSSEAYDENQMQLESVITTEKMNVIITCGYNYTHNHFDHSGNPMRYIDVHRERDSDPSKMILSFRMDDEPRLVEGEIAAFRALKGAIEDAHANGKVPVINALSFGNAGIIKILKGVVQRLNQDAIELHYVFTNDDTYAFLMPDNESVQIARQLKQFFATEKFKWIINRCITPQLPECSDQIKKFINEIASEFNGGSGKKKVIASDAVLCGKTIEKLNKIITTARCVATSSSDNFFVDARRAFDDAFTKVVDTIMDSISPREVNIADDTFDYIPLHDTCIKFIQNMHNDIGDSDLKAIFITLLEYVKDSGGIALYGELQKIHYDEIVPNLRRMGKFLRNNSKAYEHLCATFAQHYHRKIVEQRVYKCSYHKESLTTALVIPMLLCITDFSAAKVALFHDVGKMSTCVIVNGNAGFPGHGEFGASILLACTDANGESSFTEDELNAIKDHMCCGYHYAFDSENDDVSSAAFQFKTFETASRHTLETRRLLTLLSFADMLGSIPETEHQIENIKLGRDLFSRAISTVQEPTFNSFSVQKPILITPIGASGTGKSTIRRELKSMYGERVIELTYDLRLYAHIATLLKLDIPQEDSAEYYHIENIWRNTDTFTDLMKKDIRDFVIEKMYKELNDAKGKLNAIIIVDALFLFYDANDDVFAQYLKDFPKFDGFRVTILTTSDATQHVTLCSANKGDITRHTSLYGCSPNLLQSVINGQKRPHMVCCSHIGLNRQSWIGFEALHKMLRTN